MRKARNGTGFMKLVDGILKGDRLCLARSMTLVENGDPEGDRILLGIFPRVGRAFRLGITGPPGCGKSTLIRALAQSLSASGKTIGVVAVDPSSPFTGGALLGDRIRMNQVAMDRNLFIRSMASRGSFGGLSTTSQSVADLLDAFGRDYIIYETVGVGQTEIEIADAADTTVVVLSPESGDGIQAMKAGLMEIADILVINKADREGVDRLALELDMALQMRPGCGGGWEVPVLRTVASRDEGIGDLLCRIEEHRGLLGRMGLLAERRESKMRKRIRLAAENLFRKKVMETVGEDVWRARVSEVLAGRSTPAFAAEEIVNVILPAAGSGGEARRK